jgi:phosphatidylserine/phosphatidylglycerophosphate/cardiolipin synthase-like enzyme
MKKLISGLALALGVMVNAHAVPVNVQCAADVEFSPNGGGEALVVQAIDQAQNQILVQAYNFTDPAILQALLTAKINRHVDVRLILDKSNQEARYENNIVPFVQAGIPVAIDYSVAIAHNKVMIIDQRNVITGSFNYTVSAQRRNAENVILFQNCPMLAAPYIQNWNNRLNVSRPFQQ